MLEAQQRLKQRSTGVWTLLDGGRRMSEKPLVRTEGTVAEKLDDGLVIYDDTTKQAHALNESAARVWSLADGRCTLFELAQKAELDEQRTAEALDELAGAGLLVDGPGISRRAVLRRAAVIGAGAATAAPLIDTVLIPTAAAHASTVQTGGNGGGGGQLGPPVAVDDSYTTAAGKALTVPAPGVLGNDVSPSGAALTAILVSGPGHGSLSLNGDGSFTYTPAGGFSGTDSFTYQASDGTQTSNTATVTVTVNRPLAPVANNDSYTTAAGTALTVPSPGVLGNDVSPSGAPLTAALVSGPAHGTLSFNANGSFTYTPAGGFSGTDSFTYQASDGTQTSNTATVAITVNPSLRPVANNDSYTAAAGKALTVPAPGVLGNDVSPSGAALTAILVSGPGHGSLSLNGDGSFTYTPAGGFSGTDSFTYQASDGTQTSNTATVAITVT